MIGRIIPAMALFGALAFAGWVLVVDGLPTVDFSICASKAETTGHFHLGYDDDRKSSFRLGCEDAR